MAGLERTFWQSQSLIVLVVLFAAACSSGMPKSLDAPAGTSTSAPKPVTEEPAPEVPEDQDPYELEAPPQEPIVEVPVPDPEPEPEPEDDTVVTIDTGVKDVTQRQQTLAQAAQAERERRQIAEPTDIVITDKTLAEYATGDLTTVEVSEQQRQRQKEASDLQTEMEEKEAFWRGRAREIRQAWRDAYDKIPELEEKVFQLRQQFYREDDGFYRDGEIKPAWDRAIDQLEEARLEVERSQEELTEFIEGGREAGALPGWLREGLELEPVPVVPEDETAEPGEPVIYQQEATDPP